jgi:hypothetical protein
MVQPCKNTLHGVKVFSKEPSTDMAPSEKNVVALILIAALTLHLTAAISYKRSCVF